MDRFIEIVRTVDVGCMLSRAEFDPRATAAGRTFRRTHAPASATPAGVALAGELPRGHCGAFCANDRAKGRAMKLPVIIANYNYRDFGAAISGALAARQRG
jgi:hypothetical protein